MALPTLASVSDLAAWLGLPISETDPRALAVLALVSARIRSETGVTWVDEAGDYLSAVPDDVAGVVLSVAGRIYQNPRGVISEGAGPFSVTYSAAATGFALNRDELSILAKYRRKLRGLYTVATTRGDAGALDTIYVPTGPPPSGYDFPWYAKGPDGQPE